VIHVDAHSPTSIAPILLLKQVRFAQDYLHKRDEVGEVLGNLQRYYPSP